MDVQQILKLLYKEVNIIIFISCIVVLISLLFLFLRRKKKLEIELSQKIQFFQEQVNIFFEDYSNLIKEIVSGEQESFFSEKWQDLYSEIIKYRISKKHKVFSKIDQFKTTFKNLHKLIFQSNTEITRKENVKNLAQRVSVFFDELFDITSNYVAYSNEIKFIEKWKTKKPAGRFLKFCSILR